MTKKLAAPVHVRPDAVVGDGERMYEVTLDQSTVEALAEGWCPEALAQRAHWLLGWTRAEIRIANRRAQKKQKATA